MICPKCGAQLPDGTLFCTECGASIEANGNSSESQAPEPAVAATPEPQSAEQPVAPTQTIPQPAEQPAAPTQPIPQPAEQPTQQMPPQQAAPTQQIPQQPTANQGVPPVPPVPPIPPQQGYGQAGAQPNGQPTPYAAYANPQATEGLSTGMKVLWLFVGMLLGLIGVLIAYFVNKSNGDKAKSDGLKFSLIGMVITLVLTIILTFAGVACTASILNEAAQNGSLTTTTTTTTTKPSTNSGSSSSASSSSASSSSSSSASASSSSSAAKPATANPAYFDSYNGLTVSGAINLSGAEIASQLEALDFEYSSIYEGWLSKDYSRTFDAEDANSKWLTRDAVLTIPAGATNGDVMLLITDDKHYASITEAADALVNVQRIQTKQIDENTQFELVSNDAGQRFLLMESYSGTEIDIKIVPESFIQSGGFNTYMDGDFPKSIDEIWNMIAS